MGNYLYNNTDEMTRECHAVLKQYREAIVIAYNDEDDRGGTYEVVAYDDGSYASFEDRCRQSVDYAFNLGAYDNIVIATNLTSADTALAISIVGDRMMQDFKNQGDEMRDYVLFNGQRFNMKYLLEPETAPSQDEFTKKDEWFSALGIEKVPEYPVNQ